MYDNLLTDRQKLILKAIIEEYVATNEPVGSKSLTGKPYLDFSSSLLRADMARLENLGLLEKTHTSSGRVPSVEGYKYYVEHLVTRDFNVCEEFPLIDKILNDRTLNREQIVKRTMDLLSNLTNCITVAQQNDYSRLKIAQLDLVELNQDKALLLIITNTGLVETKPVHIPEFGFAEYKKVISALNDALKGVRISEVAKMLGNKNTVAMITDYIDYKNEILSSFVEAFDTFSEGKTYRSTIDPLFDIPEFQDIDTLRGMINSMYSSSFTKQISNNTGLQVRIGRENAIKEMENCSVISVPYSVGGEPIGQIAVIGPTRMDYKKVIPLLEYIANNMSKLF